MSTTRNIIGGIEGGGTKSNITLINVQTSEIVAQLEIDKPTNFYHIGMEETCRRCRDFVVQGLQEAGIDPKTKLKGLALSLSGLEAAEKIEELKKTISTMFPDLSQDYVVASDTVGTLATGTGDGGLVLIAGTGSNALLSNPETPDQTERCGGWGHMMGDEGSAYWVAHRAIKFYFDKEDCLDDPPHDICKIKAAVHEYFDVKDRFGMLEHLYDGFSKAKFAGLTAKLAAEANAGDKLCKMIFQENGQWLGKYVRALAPKMSPQLKENLKIVCVGSVWKSWNLMKDGFWSEVKDVGLKKVTLAKLKVPMSVGACYLVARKIDIPIKATYEENCTILEVKQF